MTSPRPRRPIEHYQLSWRGITVRASYDPDFCNECGGRVHVAHVEVCNAAKRQPLPMTETGYKSLFLPFGEVEAVGGVVAYVTRWLDAASLKPGWKALEQERRQGRLF